MTFPFSEDSVLTELVGKTMVLSYNVMPLNSYSKLDEFCLLPNGKTNTGCFWDIEGQRIRIMDSTGNLWFLFDGLDCKNGVVRITGRGMLMASTQGHQRVLLHEKKPLSSTKWGIRISSHVDYVDTAVPPLLKSLKKQGFPKENIVVVIGAAKDESIKTVDGFRYVSTKGNKHGFIALTVNDSSDMDYWLLLHDTCDVEKGFMDRIGTVDVGLNPDLVSFSSEDWPSEIGLYSSVFLYGMQIPDSPIKTLMASITGNAELIVHNDERSKTIGMKDVYGTGTVRKTVSLRGIRKHFGTLKDGGKP